MTINDVPLGWEPPDFGVTFLGTGHGFDTKDATSGHIIWINGKGIMVDPPPFSTAGLKYYGISPNIIDKILISVLVIVVRYGTKGETPLVKPIYAF